MKHTIWHTAIIVFLALYGVERMGLFRSKYPMTEQDFQREAFKRQFKPLFSDERRSLTKIDE